MKVKHVSLIVLFLSTFFSLQATTNCEAPAPTSASIDDQWPTAMAISWSEVPGALSYKVVVSEFITGNVVETAYLPARTTFTATGLTPDVAYHYDISASLCASGPYGDPISLSAGGIIVDIILQITCEDGGDTTFDDAVSAGFSSEELEFYVNRTQTECYLVEVDPAFSPFNETYTFGITSGSTFQVRYESGGGDGEFLMSTDENAIHAGVAYHGNQTPLAINLFDLQYTWEPEGWEDVMRFSLRPATSMDLVVTRCESCDLLNEIRKERSRPLRAQHRDLTPDQAIGIYPNPAQDLLQLQLSEAGNVEIWDFTGRQWYSRRASEVATQQEVDVQSWPTGTYMLRWYPPNQPPVVQYFMKH